MPTPFSLLFVVYLLGKVAGRGQVENDRDPHQQEIGNHRAPPDHPLGSGDVQISQHVYADQQSGHRPREMRNVPDVLVDVQDVPVVDRRADIADRDDEEDQQLEQRELHLLPVHDDGRDVGGDEGVDAPAGAGQLDGGVGDGGAEGAGDDAREVDEEDAPPPVHHFQRETEEDLDAEVHDQMENAEKKRLNWFTMTPFDLNFL